MLTTSKDWKAVSNDSSAASTYGIEDGQLTKMCSSPDTITKCPSTTNFNFWWSVEGTTVNVCIHDFDDVKEESNKAASNDKHLLQE